jgi:hypothetical protein
MMIVVAADHMQRAGDEESYKCFTTHHELLKSIECDDRTPVAS